jgi:cytochrome c oxidase subunit II
MEFDLPLFPEAASTFARDVDLLYIVWSAITLFFSLLIAGAIVFFMVKFRRRDLRSFGIPEKTSIPLEITWSIIPLIIAMTMFGWGARVYFKQYRPPADALEYWTVGKQWMWKFQHPDGQREINTLHIPVGQPIKLTIASEDVIHSFFVPAFRVKQDAVPGRYTQVWFEATKPGVYKMFCAEYCGGEHSKMIGSIVAMEPQAYEEWLAGGPAGRSMVASGAELFTSLACDTCHTEGPGRAPRAPRLEGLFGNQVALASGRTLLADEEYLRSSILNPHEQIVAGWQPIMPTYQGQITEEQLAQLVAYIRSLSTAEAGAVMESVEAAGATTGAGGEVDAPTPQTAGPARDNGN